MFHELSILKFQFFIRLFSYCFLSPVLSFEAINPAIWKSVTEWLFGIEEVLFHLEQKVFAYIYPPPYYLPF